MKAAGLHALALGLTTLAGLTLIDVAICRAGETAAPIKVGQTLPYSGPLSAFGAIGRAQDAYFRKLNAEGGINGRPVTFISLDDAYAPHRTVEQTRKLVEQDDVLLMFGSLGTATNGAVHRYLNNRGIPQLFVLSGAAKWNDPSHYPWTTPGVPAYETEGGIYGQYVKATNRGAKIAILFQNDDFGRGYLAGFKRALGSELQSMVVAEASYEATSPTISSQLAMLKASGADVLLSATLGKFTTQAVRGVAELGWKPTQFFVPASSSSLAILEAAGLDNAVGLISSSYGKDIGDEQWVDAADVKAYRAFMAEYLPHADPANDNYASGYVQASLLTAVLRACGDDLSRQNIMRQATSLHELELPLTLPGVRISSRPDDVQPFRMLRLRRFDGRRWIGFGDLMHLK